MSMRPSEMLSVARTVVLLVSVLVAVSSGTNYIYSAYAPQLAARLRVSHTQLNIIGLGGNTGVYTTGPLWGRILDRKGPRIPLISASVLLFIGYLGIKQTYDNGIIGEATVSSLHLVFLVVCAFMTGAGGNAGLGAAINVTAKSFPSGARATATGLVMSGFGLSAFWFTLLARTFFPGDTSALLLLLSLGTAIPMAVSLFILKPVPLFPRGMSLPHPDGSEESGNRHSAIGTGDAQSDRETDTDDSAPLLLHDQDVSSYEASASRESNPSASYNESSIIKDNNDGLPNIYGMRLWTTPDFYLAFAIMGICSGTGIMYINNVGSIANVLYADAHAAYDDAEAFKWQAAQVSILSGASFAGRILIGLISDFTYTRFRLPRAYCLCIVSSFFVISQAAAMIVSSVETLWIATLILGLAYGFLFGIMPTITLEWFGMAHFAENFGYMSFSPAVGGNLFSLMFGIYLDAHTRAQNTVTNGFFLVLRGDLSGSEKRRCFDGKGCYLGSLQVTLVACIVSLGLSWWAGFRDGQKVGARNAAGRVV